MVGIVVPKMLIGAIAQPVLIEFRGGGTTLSIIRRLTQQQNYFRGHGIDIGGGGDSIARYANELGFIDCRNWDIADGDAQYLEGVADNQYDFLYSSHCLEHMLDPTVALENWVRVVKPGGNLVIMIPEEELYEHLHWPPRYNTDHKFSFTIYKPEARLPNSINVFDLLKFVGDKVEILKIERLEAGYRNDVGDADQTWSGDCECAIEIALRKL